MSDLPQRTARPTLGRCPECKFIVALYRAGTTDFFMSHTTEGIPLLQAHGVECLGGGYHVEDNEVIR